MKQNIEINFFYFIVIILEQDEWTKIPVPAKIVKILVNELNQNFESENEHNDGDDDEDEVYFFFSFKKKQKSYKT